MSAGQGVSGRVVVVTRSTLEEPPRLRHQVAQLLSAVGLEVLFVEKPRFARRGVVDTTTTPHRTRSGELVHHQFRFHRMCSLFNSSAIRWSLASIAREWADAAVVNFNYDYWTLRDLWPSARIITIINDDFVNRARPWAATEARWAQGRTLQVSDAVFAVSHPLVRQCQEFAPDAALFLPWARRPYVAPGGGDRKAVLYWGYINDRVDWGLVIALLDRGQRIHFVGPVERSSRGWEVLAHRDARYHGVHALDAIPEVLADCCCSILPYDLSRSHLEVTVSNRTFDLLACGLPVIHAAYPEWLAAPPGVFQAATTVAEYAGAIGAARSRFEEVQQVIESFLRDHTSMSRFDQLWAALHPTPGVPGGQRNGRGSSS